MPLRELLLNSSSFTGVLKQYAINPADFVIKDEMLILSRLSQSKEDVFRETILIEAYNSGGPVNLIGTIHCNLSKKLAVFELESAEQTTGLAGCEL